MGYSADTYNSFPLFPFQFIIGKWEGDTRLRYEVITFCIYGQTWGTVPTKTQIYKVLQCTYYPKINERDFALDIYCEIQGPEGLNFAWNTESPEPEKGRNWFDAQFTIKCFSGSSVSDLQREICSLEKNLDEGMYSTHIIFRGQPHPSKLSDYRAVIFIIGQQPTVANDDYDQYDPIGLGIHYSYPENRAKYP